MPEIAILLLKAGLAVFVVVGATVAAERAGPFWGALITSLPISMGPIYVVLAIDQSDAFITDSTLSSFAVHAAMPAFLAAGTIAATRFRHAVTVAAAIGAWGLTALAIHSVTWTVGSAIALNVAAFIGAYVAVGLWGRPGVAVPAPSRWFDLPLRALLVASLTIVVSLSSAALGPKAAGILAVFPVVLFSATIVLLARLGRAATAATLSRAVIPLVGLGLTPLTAHLATPHYGSGIGLALGFAATLSYSTVLILWHLRGTALFHRQRRDST
ncbi:MAG: hypothetical protein WD767_06440 [Alphaproteobacteria bacterium]